MKFEYHNVRIYLHKDRARIGLIHLDRWFLVIVVMKPWPQLSNFLDIIGSIDGNTFTGNVNCIVNRCLLTFWAKKLKFRCNFFSNFFVVFILHLRTTRRFLAVFRAVLPDVSNQNHQFGTQNYQLCPQKAPRLC